MTIATLNKSGPFTHAPNSVPNTMFMVLLALTPATLFNAYLFGWPAIFLFLVPVGVGVGTTDQVFPFQRSATGFWWLRLGPK